jgi:hypothetical protein
MTPRPKRARPTPPPPKTPRSLDQADTTDWKAEAERWKGLARKHEDRAKANATAARELDDARKQSMTDVERAVAEARIEARRETLVETGARLVDAEVRAAAAGRAVDVTALLEATDRQRFIGEDGEPDTKAIRTWVERIAPKTNALPDLGQGTRSSEPLNGDPLEQSLRLKLGM